MFGQLPVEVRVLVVVPHSVKPDAAYRAIVGEQLFELVVHERVVGFPLSVTCSAGAASCTSERVIIVPIPVKM